MAPAQKLARAVAHKKHADYNDGSGNKGRATHLFELIKAKFQAQSKEQKDNADFRPSLHVDLVGNSREKDEIGAGDKASDNIAQHQGLVDFFEKNSSNTSDQKNHGQGRDDCG